MKRSGIFQFLGYILAEAAQIAAAFARLTGAENLFIAREFWLQQFTLWLLLWLWGRGFFRRCISRGGGFFLFQLKQQIKLVSRVHF